MNIMLIIVVVWSGIILTSAPILFLATQWDENTETLDKILQIAMVLFVAFFVIYLALH